MIRPTLLIDGIGRARGLLRPALREQIAAGHGGSVAVIPLHLDRSAPDGDDLAAAGRDPDPLRQLPDTHAGAVLHAVTVRTCDRPGQSRTAYVGRYGR